MRQMLKSVMLLPVFAALSLAGPPAGGHSSGQSGGHAMAQSRGSSYSVRPGPPAVSGPTPIGASGSAPVGGVGSLRPVYGVNNGQGYYAGQRPGRRNPYGYYPGPFVMPFYGYGGYGDDSYDAGYSPMPDYGAGPYAGPAASDEALGYQLQQLSAEIQDLRYHQQQQQQGGAMAAPAGSGDAADSEAQNDVPVTLVLHSGLQLQVKNYAITDGVFWNFSKHPAQRIPVSSIDVPASAKATAAQGGDFPPITQ